MKSKLRTRMEALKRGQKITVSVEEYRDAHNAGQRIRLASAGTKQFTLERKTARKTARTRVIVTRVV